MNYSNNITAEEQFYWIDVDYLAARSQSEPYLFDACLDATPPNGVPLGDIYIYIIYIYRERERG